jgi:hypothetical protein
MTAIKPVDRPESDPTSLVMIGAKQPQVRLVEESLGVFERDAAPILVYPILV